MSLEDDMERVRQEQERFARAAAESPLAKERRDRDADLRRAEALLGTLGKEAVEVLQRRHAQQSVELVHVAPPWWMFWDRMYQLSEGRRFWSFGDLAVTPDGTLHRRPAEASKFGYGGSEETRARDVAQRNAKRERFASRLGCLPSTALDGPMKVEIGAWEPERGRTSTVYFDPRSESFVEWCASMRESVASALLGER